MSTRASDPVPASPRRRVVRRPWTSGLIVSWLTATAACGGSSYKPPTGPTPVATLPPGGACGTLGLTPSTSILNGVDCAPERSAVVLLNMRASDGSAAGACSGTVIAPRAILTAAHCLAGETATVRIWLGTGAEVPATSFARHPGYQGQGSSAADVGIVVSSQDLPRTPIPLLLSRDAIVGEAAVVAGWGRDLSSVPATLRAGLTALTAVGSQFLETQFGTNVSSVCSGDSGGPILLAQGGVWGIGGVTSATSENICNTGTNFYVSVRNGSISSFILDRVPDAARF